MITRRYTLYLCFFFVQFVCYSLQFFGETLVENIEYDETDLRNIIYLIEIFFFLVPVVPIIYMFTCEPFVFSDVKKQMRKLLNLDTQDQTTKFSVESINTFLNSHNNAKFVATILVGIITKMNQIQVLKFEEDQFQEVLGPDLENLIK